VILQNGLLLMEKRNAEADAAFRKLYAPGQGDPRALAGLVTNQLAHKKFAEAVALFKPELERNASPGLRQVYAETLARAGRLDEALAEYRGLLGQYPKALELHVRVGEILQAQGKIGEAVQSFEAAAKLASDSRADAGLALAYMLAERYADAVPLYRQIVERTPGDLDRANNLAYALAETGQSLPEAQTLSQKAQGSAPTNPSFADTAAWVLFKSGQREAARQMFARIVQKSREVAAFRYHYAQVLLQHGDRAGARTQLESALVRAQAVEAVRIQALLKKLS
jgi:tetratricopeptide (TPR) repeat protein